MQTLTNTQPSSVSASVSRSLLFHALGARLPVEDVVLVAQHYEVIALKETRVWGANVTGPLQEARNVIPRKERPCTRASAMKSQRMSVASKGGGGSRDMKAFKQTLTHSNSAKTLTMSYARVRMHDEIHARCSEQVMSVG